jgi:hypothetical protein
MTTLSERLQFILSVDADGGIRSMQRFGASAEKELSKADTRIDKLGSSFVKFGAGAVATAGVAAVGLFKMAKASEEAALMGERLDNTLANQGQLAGANRQAFVDLAEALQRTTAADADAIVGAEALLGQFGLTERQILELTPLVVDLSRKLGIDLDTAAKMVGKSVDGSATALKRAGITVNATRFETDAYGATMEGLRNTVGGFAEQEGSRLSGRLTSLGNQFEDVAEEVGVGVVSAFEKVTPAISGTLDALNGVDGATKGAAGEFATFAVAGIGVAGTLSFVAGKVIDARERFQTLFTTLDGDGSRSLNRAGAALGVAGVAGAIFVAASAMDQLLNKTQDASAIAGELARVTGDELVKQFEKQAATEIKLGNVTSAYTVLARENLGAAIALRNAYAAQGKDVTELTRIIDEESEAQRTANTAADLGSEAVSANTDATDENTVSKRQQTAATFDAAAAAKAQAGALREAYAAQAVTAGLDEAFDEFTESLNKSSDAGGRTARSVDLVAEKQKAVESATRDAESAFEQFATAIEKVEDANKDLLEAQRKLDEALAGPSARDKSEAVQAQTDAELDLEDAKDRVADAQTKLNDAEAAGDPDDIRRKRNDLAQAKRGEEEATERLTEAVDENNAAQQWTADKAPEVIAAREAVTEAEKRQRDAVDEAAKKYGEMNEAARKADETINASVQSFATSDGSLYNNRLNVDATKQSYEKLADAIRAKTVAILEGGLAEATTLEQLDKLQARVDAQLGLTQEQRNALRQSIQTARNTVRGPADTRVASERASGGNLPPGDTIVGENGPERIRRTATGWEVIDANRTRSMLRGAGSSQYGDINVHLHGASLSPQDVGREVAWATRTN